MRTLALTLALCLVGCSQALPARPDVSFYVDPTPMLIPQAPVARPGINRKLQPPPVPAPVCMTDRDHLALTEYLDAIDALRR